MNPRLLLAIAAGVVLAFGGLAAGCDGDGGELTLEEYFQRLDATFQDADERGEALGDPGGIVGDPQLSLEQKRDAVTAFFNEFLAIITDVTGNVEALDPPAEVEDAHSDLLTALRGFQQSAPGAIDKVDTAQSESEFEALGEEFHSGGEGLEPACLALQAIADQNNIAVDLQCRD